MPEQDPPTAERPLTLDQVNAIYAWVMHHGRARKRAQGEGFRTSDFLAGAMCAYFACRSQGKIPGSWIFSTMAGIDVLDDKPEPEEEEVPEPPAFPE